MDFLGSVDRHELLTDTSDRNNIYNPVVSVWVLTGKETDAVWQTGATVELLEALRSPSFLVCVGGKSQQYLMKWRTSVKSLFWMLRFPIYS